MKPDCSEIGSRHLHIDGANRKLLVKVLVWALRFMRFYTRFHYITRFVAGPQRAILPKVYQAHTPGSSEEKLEFFTTTFLDSRVMAVKAARLIPIFRSWLEGAVVEIEQVVAQYHRIWERKGYWVQGEEAEDDSLTETEIGFTPEETSRFEIHHQVDLAPGTYVDLADLMNYCSDHDLRLGGWFVFADREKLALRSNCFTDSPDFRNQVEIEAIKIGWYFKERSLEVIRHKVLVEKVLLVWNSR